MSARMKLGVFALTVIAGIAAAFLLPQRQGWDLPAAFLGRWYEVETSGGVSGGVTEAADGAYVVVEPARILRYSADDELLDSQDFELTRGPTIFGERLGYLLDAAGPAPRVIRMDADGSLSIADNVHDGFSTLFRRSH